MEIKENRKCRSVFACNKMAQCFGRMARCLEKMTQCLEKMTQCFEKIARCFEKCMPVGMNIFKGPVLK